MRGSLNLRAQELGAQKRGGKTQTLEEFGRDLTKARDVWLVLIVGNEIEYPIESP